MTYRSRIRRYDESADIEFEVGVLVRLSLVAATGYLASLWQSTVTSLALIMVLWAIPMSILIPARRRGAISDSWGQRCALFLSLGLVTVFAAAFVDVQPDSYPRTAVILGVATAHLTLMWLHLRPKRLDIVRAWTWYSACAMGIVGVLIDLPELGWHTLTYFLYGAVASVTFRRLTREPESAS